MECIYQGSMKNPITGLWLKYPCGQCLACRVRRQSSWMLRNLLESQTALSKSFWTLTFSDDNIHVLDDLTPRQLSRRFFDALRTSETRAGNSQPIRYYGCYEYGGKLGRPHFHFLMYNVIANHLKPTKRKDGLPTETLHISQWPHGHIDVGEVTKASIRYVTNYITTFDKEDAQPILIKTIRPAIGYFGLERLVDTLVKQSITLQSRPAYFKLGNRSYPLDQWTRKTFNNLFEAKGGKYNEEPDPLDRKLFQLRFTAQKIKENTSETNAKKYSTLEAEKDLAHGKKTQTELAVSYRYQKIISRNIPDENSPPEGTLTQDVPFFD